MTYFLLIFKTVCYIEQLVCKVEVLNCIDKTVKIVPTKVMQCTRLRNSGFERRNVQFRFRKTAPLHCSMTRIYHIIRKMPPIIIDENTYAAILQQTEMKQIAITLHYM